MAPSLNNQAKVATTSFILFCLSLFLTAYSAKNPQLAQAGFAILSEVQRPFQIVVKTADDSVGSVWQNYINLIGVKAENDAMSQRLATLESMNSKLLEYKSENERLKGMLNALEEHKFQAITASVIGYDSTSFAGTVVLDRGSNHGVSIEMPVAQTDNVVGQIIAVSPNTSKALLITDPTSAVDAIVQDSRVRGTVKGIRLARICELNYILPDDQVRVGDRLITSGMDQIFPKGLLIGIVSSVDKDERSMFQKIMLKTSVDFKRLEEVLIITNAAPGEKGEDK